MQRAINKWLSGGALAALLVFSSPAGTAHAAPAASGGITVAPAAVRVDVPTGQTEANTSVSLTNRYQAPVVVGLSIERSAQDINQGTNPASLLSLSAPTLTIPAGATATEVITLRNATSLSPGSRTADLIITQRHNDTTQGVGIQPAVRLPITLIKHDGAVMSLGLTNIASPRFTTHMPGSITLNIRNTGNMTAIPRGTVTIHDSRGNLVGQGTMNSASAAVAPGASLSIPVAMTQLEPSRTPGAYTVSVSYGLGGDSQALISQKSYVFVAWWHIAAVIALVLLLAALIRSRRRIIKSILGFGRAANSQQTPPAKRRILIGRNA